MVKILYYTSTANFIKAWEHVRHIERAFKENDGVPGLVEKGYWLVRINLLVLQGNIKEALPLIHKIAAVSGPADEPYMDFNLYDISMYRCPYRIFMKIYRERPEDYEALSFGYRSLIASHPGYFQLVKGEDLYERGDPGAAVPELIAALDEAREAGFPGAMVPAVITLAKIRRARGDVKGAMEILLECERWLSMVHKPHWEYKLRAFKIYFYYIPMGDTEWIDNWIKESRLDIYQDITGACEYELIVLARALLFMRRYDTAEILLNRLWSFARVNNRAHSLVEILNLLAITVMKGLDEDLAMEFFENALSIGMAENYVNIFADELNPMASLLEAYIRKHTGGDKLEAYAIKLNSQTRDRCIHAVFSPDPGALDSLLTSTERKVLRMITNAYTNQEIAAELNITLRTVKAHTGRIYEKLGVKNRVQCLKKVKP
jgi:LuxR family maltose regulon positive regulatory protein